LKKPADYIIFPLDVSSTGDAKRYVEMLSGHVGMFKVGLELFVRSGPTVIEMIKGSGPAGIFLDLKLHDIPETVRRAVRVIADFGVDFITVHCGETQRMLEAAVEGGGEKVGVLGVTVLTSVSAADIRTAGFGADYSDDVSKLVMTRAAQAKAARCAGIVCSALEVNGIKEHFGREFTAVTPGIRPDWDGGGPDDQRRVATPARAIQNGSDYLVIGRPIREAADPREAAMRVAREIEAAL
jgi:orotidine-5'-phosphate decarboxylase